MAMYSAKKNMPNFMALYSTWKPATISASDSTRSKGVRLVSAYEATRKMMKAMGWRKTPQLGMPIQTLPR
ncbi:hypothetical protein D3C86_1586980 [compost metagenome]